MSLTIEEQRKRLPVWSVRQKLVDAVKSFPVLIIVGETGSGKTTQIPQFLLEHGFADGNGIIACTQPRRVAALTVAQRVAQERGTEPGKEVGYTVRFDDCTCKNTKLKYMTDGMLLREALLDPLLRRYSTVLLDEAHERTVATDVLLGLLKAARSKRKGSFRIIIMSATLDVKGYQRFFPGAQAVYVKGRQHPVEVMYTHEPQESYLDALVTAAIQIHVDEPEGDILGFLTGQDEIEIATRLIKERAKAVISDPGCLDMLHVIPMFAALPSDKQLLAFQPVPAGHRKIVLSTNIAETSITIPGIKYVVDTGFVKSRAYNASLGADCLQVIPISQAQAWQRTGRAGREGPGKCFRLFTEESFLTLDEVTEPEIRRANLASIVLQLKSMGIENPLTFDFMDPPPKTSLLRALELLYALQALDPKGTLTDMGKQLARLPVDPMFARCLLLSGDVGCSEEMLAIVSMVSCDATVFLTPSQFKEESREAHKRFFSAFGDHQTLLSIFHSWKSTPAKQRRAWCKENFINSRALSKASDIYAQLKNHLESLSIPLSSSDDSAVIRKALVAGLFPHAAKRQQNGSYKVISTGLEVKIHPSSVLHGKAPDCIIFNEVVKTSRQYVRGVTVIEVSWLPEIAPAYFSRKSSG